jgi:YD repeat-containing protein
MSIIDPSGHVTESLYDSRGRALQTRRQSRDADGNIQWLVTRSVYDASGSVSATTDEYLEGSAEPVWGTRNSYDNDGRLTMAERLKGVQIELVGSGPSLRTVLVSVGTVVSETNTTYDKLGRVIVSKDRFGTETRLTYNRVGELVGAKRGRGPFSNFSK